MTVPHPIPYQGSKRNLAPVIARYFPADGARLIEPFAGSAALSIYAAQRNGFEEFILNDINAPLMDLWDAILTRPTPLADWYETLWHMQKGREDRFYYAVRRRFNENHHPYYFLYLLARCVKAAVRYNTSGEFNQSPDNRRKGRHPNAMRQDIETASRLMSKKTRLHTGDYQNVLELATPEDVVYLDPPYQGVCANRDPRYVQMVSFHDFAESLRRLNEREISFIVSYDGRTGQKTYGESLPLSLDLVKLEIDAGRSSQATLLGRTDKTYESIYLSRALVARLDLAQGLKLPEEIRQLPLFT